MPSGPSSSSTPLPAIILLPLFLARLRQQRAGGFWLFAIGLAMGLTQFFYSLSVLHTEIVRAMILFYFNPVWATIMARIFLGEAITPIRWLAIAVAFSGMFIILGIDQGLPWPRNRGDWAAVVAGVAWASSIVLLRHHQGQKPLDLFHPEFHVDWRAAAYCCWPLPEPAAPRRSAWS